MRVFASSTPRARGHHVAAEELRTGTQFDTSRLRTPPFLTTAKARTVTVRAFVAVQVSYGWRESSLPCRPSVPPPPTRLAHGVAVRG